MVLHTEISTSWSNEHNVQATQGLLTLWAADFMALILVGQYQQIPGGQVSMGVQEVGRSRRAGCSALSDTDRALCQLDNQSCINS